jgi:hypothetical protein
MGVQVGVVWARIDPEGVFDETFMYRRQQLMTVANAREARWH